MHLNSLSTFHGKLVVCSFMLWALLVESSTASASYRKGLEYYQSEEYQEAYFTFKNMAAVGDKPSQYNLGVMYYRGEHVDQDNAMAYAWMTLASELGEERYKNNADKIFESLDDKGKEAAAEQFARLSGLYGDDVLKAAIAPQPLSDEDCEKGPALIKSLKPEYPKDAYKGQRVSIGYSDFTLNVSAQGYARDITLRLKTNDVFVDSSVTALLKGRWEQKLIDGKPTMTRDVYYRFSYAAQGGMTSMIKKMIRAVGDTLTQAESGDIQAQYEYAKTLGSIKAFRSMQDELDTEYRTANEWLLKASQQGHPLAQYELGKNMIAGRGCKVDSESGLKWLRAAASSGHPFAQEELAMSELHSGLDDEQRIIYWLRKAAGTGFYKAKLFLAWHLATTNDTDLFSPGEAISLLNSVPSLYFDQVRIEETHAAAYAAQGDFDAAVEWQSKALKTAKKLRWEIPVMEQRLTGYKNKQRWTGMYHL